MNCRTASVIAVAALASTIPSATAATAAGREKAAPSACRSAAKAPGAKILARDKVAVVFTTKKQTVYRGCTYDGAVRKLKAICCESEAVTLGGRFAAYTYTGSAIGDETSKVGVYDLRSGKREKFAKLEPNSEGGDPAEIETYSFIWDFAVNSRGSVVWLINKVDSNGDSTGQYELRAADGSKRTERIVDSGKIGRKSLSLSANGKTIRYLKGGKKRTAPLAP